MKAGYESTLKIEINSPAGLTYKSFFEGNSLFDSKFGLYNVSGIIFISEPGSKQSISFSSPSIDPTLPSNVAYLASIPQATIDYAISVDVRLCKAGESFQGNGKCEECEAGKTYLIEQPEPLTPVECIICPTEKATCTGGSEIFPKPGWWRNSSTTSTFYECFRQDSCLGGTTDPKGECDTGY